MKLFLDVAKRRFLPSIGWIACTIPAMFIGGISGMFISYLFLATGLMKSTDELFTGWRFLTFPTVGGIIGLIIMHIIRIYYWSKLHRKCMSELEGWTWKYTIGIVVLDEAIWFVAFIAIFTILLILVSI